MRILHLSDIHLTEFGKPIWDTDTMLHFQKTIHSIKKMEGIDAIIVTGDLSDDGTEWTYQYIDNAFKSVGIPTFCCPGNHDSLNVLLGSYAPSFMCLEHKAFINGYKLLLLNSVIQDVNGRNKSRGMLDIKTMAFLRRELSENIPAIIAMHHPPLEPESWLNCKLLENRDDFNMLVANYPNVKLVLYGHIHCDKVSEVNGVLYCSAPSIGFAFSEKLPQFQIDDGNEGYSLIEILDDRINVTKFRIDEQI